MRFVGWLGAMLAILVAALTAIYPAFALDAGKFIVADLKPIRGLPRGPSAPPLEAAAEEEARAEAAAAQPAPAQPAAAQPAAAQPSAGKPAAPVPHATPSAPREEGRPVRSAQELQDQNVFYDPTNPDFDRLQKANESLVGFPLDKKGYVDWMKAIRDGTIKPRADLHGKTEMQVLDMDVIMRDTKEMPWVLFPHKSHTMWLACKNCHDQIFIPKIGANDISMGEIFKGNYCGKCHDRVAFITFFSCERCHSVPHGGTKAWWQQ